MATVISQREMPFHAYAILEPITRPCVASQGVCQLKSQIALLMKAYGLVDSGNVALIWTLLLLLLRVRSSRFKYIDGADALRRTTMKNSLASTVFFRQTLDCITNLLSLFLREVSFVSPHVVRREESKRERIARELRVRPFRGSTRALLSFHEPLVRSLVLRRAKTFGRVGGRHVKIEDLRSVDPGRFLGVSDRSGRVGCPREHALEMTNPVIHQGARLQDEPRPVHVAGLHEGGAQLANTFDSRRVKRRDPVPEFSRAGFIEGEDDLHRGVVGRDRPAVANVLQESARGSDAGLLNRATHEVSRLLVGTPVPETDVGPERVRDEPRSGRRVILEESDDQSVPEPSPVVDEGLAVRRVAGLRRESVEQRVRAPQRLVDPTSPDALGEGADDDAVRFAVFQLGIGKYRKIHGRVILVAKN